MVCRTCHGLGQVVVRKTDHATFYGKCGACDGLVDPQVELVQAWCSCGQSSQSYAFEDGQCKCGIKKHHYHCNVCGGVTQVG